MSKRMLDKKLPDPTVFQYNGQTWLGWDGKIWDLDDSFHKPLIVTLSKDFVGGRPLTVRELVEQHKYTYMQCICLTCTPITKLEATGSGPRNQHYLGISSGRITKTGNASAYITKGWNRHINVERTPTDTIFEVGYKWNLRRTTKTTYTVMTTRNPTFANYITEGHWILRTGIEDRNRSWWALVVDKPKSKSIYSIYATETSAIARGQKILESAQESGYDVHINRDIVKVSLTDSLADLIDKADSALQGGELNEIHWVKSEIESTLSNLVILQRKHEQVEKEIRNRLSQDVV